MTTVGPKSDPPEIPSEDLDESDPSGPRWGALFRGSAEIRRLEEAVRGENRFFPLEAEALEEFLDDASQHLTVVQKGTEVFRARLMPPIGGQHQLPLKPSEMGAPPANACTQGRLNPVGIPYLYVASTRETAVAEMRPWRGAEMSLATLVVQPGIELVDLRDPEGEDRLFYWFGYLATRPVHRDDELGYVATQYLSEALKHRGHHGVIYRSAQGPGHNIAFFDVHAAIVKHVSLVEVVDVAYTSSFVDPIWAPEE